MPDPDQPRQPDDTPDTLGEPASTPIEHTEPVLDSLKTRFSPELDSAATRAPSDTSIPWEASIEGFPGYELLETLGEGGMGTVYKARQEGLNRLVALKVILGGRRAGPKDLIRFLAEAEAVASIKHPHVVQVHEYGEVDGRPFLTLEYLPGGTLADKLKREKRFEPKVAAKLVAKLARAVQDAHDQGIVHRDLKPANVLFDAEGEPKVTDFGLAKRAKGTDLTQTQAVMGTPAYMSPEQAKGNTKFVGPPADIYALGVILYECLAGIRPFTDTDTHVLLRKVIEDEPLKPSKHIPGLPRDLELIALKCLAKEPAERYATAKALAEDLTHFTAGEPVSVRAVGTIERTLKWAKRKPTQAAAYALTFAVVVLMAFGVSLAMLWRNEQAARVDESKERMNAEAARDIARKAEVKVKEARDKLAGVEYGRTMQVAHQEWRDDNVVASLALVEGTDPKLRGWEWWYLHYLSNNELLKIQAYSGSMLTVSWSPDGSRIATAGWDTRAWVWNAGTGDQTLKLKGHKTNHVTTSWSPDGSRIATASHDGTARIWDARTGAESLVLKGDAGEVNSVSWSPDGSRIATGIGFTAEVWDARTGAKSLTVMGHLGLVYSSSWSPDGSRIATASHDGTARVWDARTGSKLLTLDGHTAQVYSVSWSPDGSRIATASGDNTVRVWDSRTGAGLLTLNGHTGQVNSVSWSPDGSRIATASGDHTARVWDSRTGAGLLTLKGHTDAVNSAAWSPNGSRIATVSQDGTQRVWDVWRNVEFLTLKGHTDAVDSAAWSPNGSCIVTASADKTARIWNSRTGAEVHTLKGHTDSVTSVSWSSDGSRIATASHDGTARVWDAGTGEMSLTLKGLTNAVTSTLANDVASLVSWSPDGSRIATVSGDGIARVLDARTGVETLTLKGNAIDSVSWSPDGARIATANQGYPTALGTWNTTVRIWNSRTGAESLTLKGHTGAVYSSSWSPDGSRIATASHDGTARVWDSRTGAESLTLKGHTSNVMSVSWSPDGSRLITTSWDKTARVWDAQTGSETLTLKGHAGTVTSALWSPDGSRIVTTSVDNTVRIWDSRSWAERLAAEN